MDNQDVTSQHVLSSWKEIASYLGKGVRTVQRWECELGLPVRRPSLEHHIVIALTGEINEWILRSSVPCAVADGSQNNELRSAHRRIAEMRREIRRLESQLRSLIGDLPVGHAAPGLLD